MRPTNQTGKQITEKFHDVDIIMNTTNRLLLSAVEEQRCNAHVSLFDPD